MKDKTWAQYWAQLEEDLAQDGRALDHSYTFCHGCWGNAKIETFSAKLGRRYCCHCCGLSGYLDDPDGPEKLTSAELDQRYEPKEQI